VGKRANAWDQMMVEVSSGDTFTITDKGTPVAIVVPYEHHQVLKEAHKALTDVEHLRGLSATSEKLDPQAEAGAYDYSDGPPITEAERQLVQGRCTLVR
jgi:antitoxin (DNA-binding transcriptional repressor) of toxin-antitoxin stability system